MPRAPEAPIAVYYEHPEWFRPLFEELERRGTPHLRVHAAGHTYDASQGPPAWSLLFNRMSPSAWQRGHGHAIFFTLQYLAHLEELGVRVVNGYRAFRVEISKARQVSLLRRLGLPCPRTRVINDPGAAARAAEGLRFPIVVKPNIGGSGAGVQRFDSPRALEEAAGAGDIELGIDRVGLVQEFIPQRAGRITRVEVLGGRYLYAIRIYTSGETFDLCPADVCQSADGRALARSACPTDVAKERLRVEAYEPPAEIVRQVEGIAAAAGIEVGGIEYFVDDRDGRLYFYDVNALSNFVADAPNVVGFDPLARLADYLESEASGVEAA